MRGRRDELTDLTELNVDEATLTGESLPVSKAPGRRSARRDDRALRPRDRGRDEDGRGHPLRHDRRSRRRGAHATHCAATPVGRLVRGLAIAAAVACVAVVAIERVHGMDVGRRASSPA